MGGGDNDGKELRSDDRSEMLSSSMVARMFASPGAGSKKIVVAGCPDHRTFRESYARESDGVGAGHGEALRGQTEVWVQETVIDSTKEELGEGRWQSARCQVDDVPSAQWR